VRLAHLLVGGLLTLATLCSVGRRRDSGAEVLLFFGSLVLLMFLLSPICHLHYFTGALPLVMGLVFVTWRSQGAATMSRGMTWLLAGNAVANAIPLFEGFDAARDLGLAMYATLALWATAGALLWGAGRSEPKTATDRKEDIGIAA
jgi:hypothetical protein